MCAHRLNEGDGVKVCEVCDSAFVDTTYSEWGFGWIPVAVKSRGRHERVLVCDVCYDTVTRRVPWYRRSILVSA